MEKKGRKRGGEEYCNMQCKKGKMVFSTDLCSIDYISHPPSLESIALVSIAIRLWTEPDINEDVKQHSRLHGTEIICTREREVYHRLEERVTKKLAEICLPDLLKIKVSNVIRPIGMQLIKCFDTKDDEYCKLNSLFEKGCSVHWTAEGIIDKRRSLEELIKNEKQENDFYQLYELACKYCLEEYISFLWEKIPLDRKMAHSSNEYNRSARMYNEYNYHIIDYWTARIKNELPNLLSKIKENDRRNIYDCNSSINQNMVTLSIFVCNAFALRYFWYKLTALEKEVNLENWLKQIIQKYNIILRRTYEYQKYHVFTDILCFLLSHSKDQSQIFQTHSEIILRALFFDWPYQRFFLPTINAMLNYLQEDVYVKIMTNIIREIKEGKTTAELFRKVWCGSSAKLKNACLPYIVKRTNVILNLLTVDDLETICLVLNGFSAEEKKEIIFNLIGSQELLKILNRDKFTLLDSLAIRTLPSDCEIERFKESLVQKYGDELYHDWILADDFQAVDKMLKWSFETPDKIESYKKNGIHKIPIFTSLVCLGDYGLINRFMNWCLESVEESNDFKHSYIRNSTARAQLLLKLGCLEEDGWDLFEEFLKYSSFSTEAVADLKKLCLEHVETLVSYSNFEFATRLLHWCLDSIREIKEFKNKLLLSEKGTEMIWCDITRKYPNWNNVKNTLKWFSPFPKKAVAYLKRDIDVDDFSEAGYEYSPKYKKQFFFHLLDNFIAGYSTSDSDSSSSDGREFMEILNDAIDNDDTECNSDTSGNSDQIIECVADLTDIDINCTDTEYYSSSDDDLGTNIS